jgi:hypothetical protein
MARPIYEIAQDIENDVRLARREGKPSTWYTYAKPYVEAMYSLNNISDDYGYDSGVSVVSYALANLGQWRGDVARAIKAELKSLIK